MSTPTAPAPTPLTRGLSAASLSTWLYRWRWLIGTVAILVLALLIVHWAGVRPGYDPYGWLVWGHLTLHGALDTNGAPSWKPLPFLFTVPYALVGKHALTLWMVTAIAISLAGVGVRLACRLRAGRCATATSLRRLHGRPGRRQRAVGDRHVLALRAQRRIGHDDRHAVPGGRGLHHLPPVPVGVLDVVARRTRPPGGMGPAGALPPVGVAPSAGDAPPDRGRRGADPGALARDPGAHLQERVLGRVAGREQSPDAARQQDHRHLGTLHGTRWRVGQAGRAGRRDPGSIAPRPRRAAAGGRGPGVGGGRDGVRAARLAGRAALSV